MSWWLGSGQKGGLWEVVGFQVCLKIESMKWYSDEVTVLRGVGNGRN